MQKRVALPLGARGMLAHRGHLQQRFRGPARCRAHALRAVGAILGGQAPVLMDSSVHICTVLGS